MFPLFSHAIAQVVDRGRLSYIGLSHADPDDGATPNAVIASAPNPVPLAGRLHAWRSVVALASPTQSVLSSAHPRYSAARLIATP